MKTKIMALLAFGIASFASAQTTVNYSDATGEVAVPGNPFPHIDITSVDVTLDASGQNLTFTINLNDSPIATNWGKYMIGIRSGAGGTSTGNGWGRPINLNVGMTHWVGGWADGPAGGLEVWKYTSSWSRIKASYDAVDPLALPVITSTSYSVTVPVALLDYTPGPGQAVTFDVYTSGGGGSDGAVDALSSAVASITNWGNTFTTTQPLFFPDDVLDPAGDEDLDGYTNGDESAGTSALGYVSNPLIPNYTNMNVAGDFNGYNTTSDSMTQGDTTSLVTQYYWTYDKHFTTAAVPIEFKFVTGGSFAINWGQGSGEGAVARDGNNIAGFVGPSGIYRFFFNQGGLSQTFTRRTFSDAAEFLAAYNLASDPAGDEDGDGISNQDEFTANTDPRNSDTDGDGIGDLADAQPLTQLRDVTLSVNMNVQQSLGNFNPLADDVQVRFFGGPLNVGTYGPVPMTESPGNPGVYVATISNVPGFAGRPLEGIGYKFVFVDSSDPNEVTFEQVSSNPFENRTLVLGTAGLEQTVPTVFFSNDAGSSPSGFQAWAQANAGGGAFDEDFDLDGIKNGIEYFFGETGSSFTANPVPVNGVVRWPRDAGATGVSFRIWTSQTLAAGSWVDVTSAADLTSEPGFVKYTIPTVTPSLFVRFEVFEQ